MTIKCVWEHNGNDTLLSAIDYIGAYTRGESLEIAKAKMPGEIVSYLKWLGEDTSDNIEVVITQEKDSELAIKDADSDMLFESEKAPHRSRSDRSSRRNRTTQNDGRNS